MLIEEKIHGIRAINTHSHHQRDDFFADMSLEKLLENSYVSWCGLSPGEDSASRQAYLDRVRHKSYFVYLMKAVKRLYEIDEDLEPYTWDMYSRAIREANADPAWHKAVLSVMCGYEKVIVDAYWDPGSCNDDRLFIAAFRIDALMFGYRKDAANHNGNSPYTLYGEVYDDLDSYMRFVDQLIREKVAGGCVALKCALAYDRPIDFEKTGKSSAEKAFGSPTPKNVRSFQNYLFHEICSLAAELDVPIAVPHRHGADARHTCNEPAGRDRAASWHEICAVSRRVPVDRRDRGAAALSSECVCGYLLAAAAVANGCRSSAAQVYRDRHGR